MNAHDFIPIGKIPKIIGYRGEVLLVLKSSLPISVEHEPFFFLKTAYGLVPFHVESFEDNGRNGAIVLFTDAKSEKKAKELVGCEVYLPLNLMLDLEEEVLIGDMVMGYTVKDKSNGLLGKVDGVSELPEQSLLEVKRGRGTLLIPLVREMILKVDHRRKTILVDLPEGLVDLNA